MIKKVKKLGRAELPKDLNSKANFMAAIGLEDPEVRAAAAAAYIRSADYKDIFLIKDAFLLHCRMHAHLSTFLTVNIYSGDMTKKTLQCLQSMLNCMVAEETSRTLQGLVRGS